MKLTQSQCDTLKTRINTRRQKRGVNLIWSYTDHNKHKVYGITGDAYFRGVKLASDSKEAGRSIAMNKGYYSDAHQDNVYQAVIVKLSHGRFLAGYRNENSDCIIVFPTIIDNERDAVYQADSHTDQDAEYARDEDIKQFAESIAEDLKDQIHDNRIQYRAIKQQYKTLNQARAMPLVQKVLANKLHDLKTTNKTHYKTIKQYQDNPYSAIDY